MSRRPKWFAAALLCLALVACAVAPGPKFTALIVPPAIYGHLYVYRPWVWFTEGATFPVRAGPVREGELANGTYLLVRLPPGWYVIDVNGVKKRMWIAGGRNHFLEFDLSQSTEGLAAVTSNIDATHITDRGLLHVRTEAEALRDLPNLRSAERPAD